MDSVSSFECATVTDGNRSCFATSQKQVLTIKVHDVNPIS